MLEIHDGQGRRNCAGFSRRTAIKAGFLGVSGLTLADRLRLDPAMMRTIYLENVANHLKQVRDAAAKLNISHVLLVAS